jgi:hypothetical protein
MLAGACLAGDCEETGKHWLRKAIQAIEQDATEITARRK